MRALRFEHTSTFPVPRRRLWGFHLETDALQWLTPPLTGFYVEDRGDGVAEGSVLTARTGWWPFRSRWIALHSGVEHEVSFTDTALESPFRYWVHQHRFDEVDDSTSRLTDTVWYLPPSWLPRWLARWTVRPALEVLFRWRHRQTRRRLIGRPRTKSFRSALRCSSELMTGG